MRTFALVAAAALLLAGGAAAQCPNIPDCNDCATEPTICTTCADGFTAVDVRSLCVPNNACLAPGSRCVVDASGNACDETDPRICLACAGGATLTFDGRCLPDCLDARCDSDPSIGCPESPETCQLCEAGYESINGYCVQSGCLAPNCAVCAAGPTPGSILPNQCLECIPGTQLNAQGICLELPQVPCVDPHCSAAPGSCPDPEFCELCMPGWTADSSGACMQDGCRVTNCIECVFDPATNTPSDRCERCLPGFRSTIDGTCKRLPPGPKPCTETDPQCKRCNEKNECAECRQAGWFYDYHYGRCRQGGCRELFEHCKECGPGMRVCTRCEHGYRWSWERYECVRRGGHRKPHRPHHKRCKKGLRLVKGRCVRVHKRHPKKPACKHGFRLVKGRCVHIAHSNRY